MSPISKADLKAQAECYGLVRQFILFSQRNAKLAGISAEQYQLLLAIQAIDQHDAATLDLLITQLFLEASEVLALCDQMLSADLIKITAITDESTQPSFQLTDQGELILKEIIRKDEIGLKRLQLGLR